MHTASSVDSFRLTMKLLLDNFPLKHCFEWGSGNSTEVMCDHPSVETVDSVDNDEFYITSVRRDFSVRMANIIHENDQRDYCKVCGDHAPYDFIFVDGRDRVNCLRQALKILKDSGIVMLHDACREKYEDGMNLYKHKFFTDGGHTATLTNNKEMADRISSLFKQHEEIL